MCLFSLSHSLVAVSTVIRLLNKEGMTGSLPNLYNSVQNMNDAYIQSKDILLKPKSSIGISSEDLFLFLDDVTTVHDKTFYGCNIPNDISTLRRIHRTNFNSGCSMSVTEDPDAICPNCGKLMSKKMNYIASEGVKGAVAAKRGFVKEAVTYMVTDDLVVKPMSTISRITLLNKFNVKTVDVLQEQVVNFRMDEVYYSVCMLVLIHFFCYVYSIYVLFDW